MKIIKKYKGGGSTTQVSTIDPELKPYLTSGLQRAQAAEESGALSHVEGFTPEQLAAQQAAVSGASTQDVLAGRGAGALDTLETAQKTGYGIDPSVLAANPQLQALKAAQIRDAQKAMQPGLAKEAAAGVVGGSRAGIQAGEREAALAGALAKTDYDALSDASRTATGAATSEISATPTLQAATQAGASTLQGVGTAIQKQQQAEADAVYQGLGRFSSLIQGTPWQSQQQTQQGGK